jgi:hypothetical protein
MEYELELELVLSTFAKKLVSASPGVTVCQLPSMLS